MKILVMSDSHGNTQAVLDAVWDVSPDLVLHLGDHERDCGVITDTFPTLALRAVSGNCDHSGGLDMDEFVLEGKRFFMTHGHLFGVKLGLSSIINSACAREADILLFGHTHNPYYANYSELGIITSESVPKSGGLIVINPGSIGCASGFGKKTYAVLKIENGAVECVFGDIRS